MRYWHDSNIAIISTDTNNLIDEKFCSENISSFKKFLIVFQ